MSESLQECLVQQQQPWWWWWWRYTIDSRKFVQLDDKQSTVIPLTMSTYLAAGERRAWYRCLLEAEKKRKLTYFRHTMGKHDSLQPCMEKDIIMGTLPGKRARGRTKTSWMKLNITAWTGLTLNVILRKTEERNEWRSVIWRAVNPRIEEDRKKKKKKKNDYRRWTCW